MNQPISRVLKPEQRASDCYDWITAEDAVRHALAAFYVASRMCQPESGEPFVSPQGGRAASRGDFFDFLTDHFRERLARHAHQAGLEGLSDLAARATGVEAVYSPMPIQVHRA